MMCLWNLGGPYDKSKIEGFGQKRGDRTEGGTAMKITVFL